MAYKSRLTAKPKELDNMRKTSLSFLFSYSVPEIMRTGCLLRYVIEPMESGDIRIRCSP